MTSDSATRTGRNTWEVQNDKSGHCPDCGTETETMMVSDKYQGEIVAVDVVNALCESCQADRAVYQ